MPHISHVDNLDAREATFNNITHTHIYNVNLSLSNSLPLEAIDRIFLHLKTTSAATDSNSSLERTIVQLSSQSLIFATINATSTTIVRIVQLLISRSSADPHSSIRDLKTSLESLHKSLLLIQYALDVYAPTPLGKGLEQSIQPSIKHCSDLVQGLYIQIQKYHENLKPTAIRGFWQYVFGSAWDLSELATLKALIADAQAPLDNFLMSLHS